MAKSQLERSAATHRERMERAEAKLAHLRAMSGSEKYRRIHRARTAINALQDFLDAESEIDGPAVIPCVRCQDALDAVLAALRSSEVK